MENSIFVPLNVPSAKNSRQWTGRYFVVSKLTQKYKANTHLIWQQNKSKFHAMIEGKEKPYRVAMYFIRDSKRRSDAINLAQIICDLMVEYEWIEDDSMDFILPVFLGYEVNKKECGIKITVL